MYSYEDRMRAVKLYIKLGKRANATIRHSLTSKAPAVFFRAAFQHCAGKHAVLTFPSLICSISFARLAALMTLRPGNRTTETS